MKLVHVYISEYKVIKKLNVPFSGKHGCFYDDQSLILRFKKNEVNYYNGVECSAVIGNNGVGKSTILNFLEEAYGLTDSSGIIIFYDSVLNRYHVCPINLYLNEEGIETSFKFKIEPSYKSFVSSSAIKLIKANNLTGLEELSFVKSKAKKFVHDLSLSQYAKGSKRKVIERTSRLLEYFSMYQNDGFERTKVTFNFKFKESSVSYVNSLINNKALRSSLDNEQLIAVKNVIENNHMDELSFSSPHRLCKELLFINLLSIVRNLSSLSIIPSEKRDIFFISFLVEFDKRGLKFELLKGLIEKVASDFIRSDESLLEMDTLIIAKKFNEISKVFWDVGRLLDFYQEDFTVVGSNEISTSNVDLIVRLTGAIQLLPSNISTNFIFGWHGLSTGEFARLNLFSELFHFINSEKRNEKEKYLLVMDEVDLFQHPDWQRTFLEDLLNFIGLMFPKDRVQLILSTHSPIIVSDFLPEDIVSLKVDNEGKTVLCKAYGFGTQITDLYLHGMHLNSTFGEYSKKLLSSILKRRDENNLTHEDRLLISRIEDISIRNMFLRKP
ncbi:AAA family ATPase [Pseudoalteromonas sp. T1lg21]|uniref:AAA family ATPase n=1 Tax=Pseudoalteromonas sp. T1lg21 TaxID=2077095 RepID=UPI001319DBB9|nr:AAA family ATPase [Pseudoalteromonas sp. T1lg21]